MPYVGYPIATLCALTLALAVDPGWSLTLTTLAAFVAVQLCTSQIIEPRLYGHATGLSPLSVVLATLFWGWLWGPVGAIMATPLTLCLAVAGRHTRSFAAIDIILGDGPALTLPQKFYQRALSGDSDEIIRGARDFLKRKPLAVYCDTILMPALALGRIDLASGAITADQQSKLRGVVVAVIESLAGAALHNPFRLPHKTVLRRSFPGPRPAGPALAAPARAHRFALAGRGRRQRRGALRQPGGARRRSRRGIAGAHA